MKQAALVVCEGHTQELKAKGHSHLRTEMASHTLYTCHMQQHHRSILS